MVRFNSFFIFLVISLFAIDVAGQASDSEKQIEDNKEKVKGLVSFLNFSMNAIGSAETPASEKDVIITQSYLKAFRDENVQVEDDLDENRDVVTNKDVQAYLKDIDFFFKDVKFEFNIDQIEHLSNGDNTSFFKVSLTRNMKGTTVDGKEINNTAPRFIEVNFNQKEQDLKIVSIYTTKLSIEKDLENWWGELSFEWKSIFRKAIGTVNDSLSSSQLLQIIDLQQLDLSANKYIIDVAAISKVAGLKSLNIANTQIEDIKALRNLTKLEILNLSNTTIDDLTPLRYAINLKELRLSNTNIEDASVLSNLVALEHLDVSNTRIYNLEPLSSATSLRSLDFSKSLVDDLSFVAALKNLNTLDLNGTRVIDLKGVEQVDSLEVLNITQTNINNLYPLERASNLNLLYADSTGIADLSPLMGLTKLSKIYCDNTKVDDNEVRQFKQKQPKVLVIHESEDMEKWWDELSFDWKNALKSVLEIEKNPTKEQLAQLTDTESLNLSRSNIVDLAPITALRNLKVLNLQRTTIQELSPLSALTALEELNISNTSTKSLIGLEGMSNLRKLSINETFVDSLNVLLKLPDLTYLSCEKSYVSDELIQAFINKKANCLVIYETDALLSWWESLDPAWMSIFENHVELSKPPNPIQLHKITRLEKINIENNFEIKSLRPLIKLNRLRELRINKSKVSDLAPLKDLKYLELLQITKSPVRKIDPIRNLIRMRELDISDTPVENIDPITILTSLNRLKFSGTEVKSLRPLSYLIELKHVEFDNTNVTSLNPILDLFNLQTLVCYNTKLSQKKIDKLQMSIPGCKITYY